MKAHDLVKKLGKHTLSLGYANVAIEALLAIVTPSNSARGAGAVFPIVSQLPPIYKSMPNDPSRRLIGSYVMYTAFVANTITSTLFVSPSCTTRYAPSAAGGGPLSRSGGAS